MTIQQIYTALRQQIPATLACEWDNDGQMCVPDPERDARRILVVLDITDEAIHYAQEQGFDLIVSHHPLIFKGVKHIASHDIVARRCIGLCRSDISALSFHTALDAMPNGVNDLLAKQLSLRDVVPFGAGEFPIGRIGTLEAAMPAEDFAALVADTLGCDAVTVGNPDIVARRVAVLGGSGKDDVAAAIAVGADTFVTGECGYHEMLDAAADGLNVITAGHFFTEQTTLSVLSDLLRAICPDATVEIYNTNRMKTVVRFK
jgi:dinuclear metal center YbgI/SA1388 family protein